MAARMLEENKPGSLYFMQKHFRTAWEVQKKIKITRQKRYMAEH